MGVRVVFPDMGKDPSVQLIEKTITENGTYDAITDGANGYSKVNVNVEGGGGSSDFSTATVTFEGEALAAMPLIVTTESGSSVDAILVSQRAFGNASYPIALYKGNAIIRVTAFEEGEVITISGGGESLGDDMYLITGDCTITITPAS